VVYLYGCVRGVIERAFLAAVVMSQCRKKGRKPLQTLFVIWLITVEHAFHLKPWVSSGSFAKRHQTNLSVQGNRF
jgi:hypothetical protein